MAEGHTITRLLEKSGGGDREALGALFKLVYDQLRRRASHQMAREDRDHLLEPPALVNEAFLRIYSGGDPVFKNRAHFFAVAARAMRQILVDYSRRRDASKRGGGARTLSLEDSLLPSGAPSPEEILQLDELLRRLGEVDKRGALVIECRFFGGMTVEETADALSCSVDSVKRSWRKARLWLLDALSTSDRVVGE